MDLLLDSYDVVISMICSAFNVFSFLMFIILFTSVDLAQGYMSNDDLERAIKEFGQRCSNISRIYR